VEELLPFWSPVTFVGSELFAGDEVAAGWLSLPQAATSPIRRTRMQAKTRADILRTGHFSLHPSKTLNDSIAAIVSGM
jgi:hypothetical protein